MHHLPHGSTDLYLQKVQEVQSARQSIITEPRSPITESHPRTANLQPALIATRGSTVVPDATYEYIPSDSELPLGENRAYNVLGGDLEIRVGENTAYGHSDVPAVTNLELNEAYNYRQPVPTPNIAYGGHSNAEGHARQLLAEEVYEYIK